MEFQTKVVGLFSGIGGLELGFRSAGHEVDLLVDIDPQCRRVLEDRFPGAHVVGDLAELPGLPRCDVLTAGFPCQPYSQAGRTRGLHEGRHILDEMFRLIDSCPPGSLLFENVPFIRNLDKGAALNWLLAAVEARGYRWAYRTIDAIAFGIPQRRRRWFMLASKVFDPAPALLVPSCQAMPLKPASSFGFYWTEGSRGIGWAEDAIPPLRVGSSLGIPSPPTIWRPPGAFDLPEIRDAERLQGFMSGWTEVGGELGTRWRMIGNAVSASNARWIAQQFEKVKSAWPAPARLLSSESLPSAAFGDRRFRYAVDVGELPDAQQLMPIARFLRFPTHRLSRRAAAGFLHRYEHGSLRKNHALVVALRTYVEDNQAEM